MSLFYVASNFDLMATSKKYNFIHEAREAAKRLNAQYPTKFGWHAVSNKPSMTPEQCMPWLKDYKFSPSTDISTEDLYA